jgi:UDP-N-acetylglucosamine 2-epimerase
MTAPIALFFGTRPQVIKASVLRDALTATGPVVAVDTGQHYDYSMHQVHYDQLGVRAPDAFLGVGSGSHGEQTAAILTACETWLAAHPARLAVVVGDTNTTMACALASAKRRIPVAHVEAGLRAADRLMAEEINRRVTDSVAHWLFAPCARVAAVLRREHPEAVVADVGDVAFDVLERALPQAPGLNPS